MHWLELVIALVDEEVHEPIVGIDHDFDLLEVLLLEELHFLAVVLRQHAHFPLADLGALGSAGEQQGVGLATDLGLDDVLVDQVTHQFDRVLLAHVEGTCLIEANGLQAILVFDDVYF